MIISQEIKVIFFFCAAYFMAYYFFDFKFKSQRSSVYLQLDMLRQTILLVILLAAASQQCNYAAAADTYPTEDFYLERPNSTAPYTINGHVEYTPGNRDYQTGPSLFFSEFLKISNCFFDELVKTLGCQSLKKDVDITKKIDGIDQAIYDDAYVSGGSWLCTVPAGMAVTGLRGQLNIHPKQAHVVGSYSLMAGTVKIEKPSDISKQVALLAEQVKRQIRRYAVTSKAFRLNIFQTSADILYYLDEAIKVNTDAKVVTAAELPNKILLVERQFPILYTTGSKILIGRFNKSNPSIIIIYSTQKLVECPSHIQP